MCLWFACFGLHKDDDVTYTAPTRSLALPPPATKPQLHDRPMPAAQRNGGYYNNGHAHYANGGHHQTAAADEAGRKAWNGSVAGEAGHGHGTQAQQQQQNYYNYHERQPVHREAAMDHRYSTATATAVHERY